jgi:hypothetical protein
MNERIKELAIQAGGGPSKWYTDPNVLQEFAELIVRECAENLTKVWYEQGMDIRGAEIGKFLTRFNEHFGVEE